MIALERLTKSFLVAPIEIHEIKTVFRFEKLHNTYQRSIKNVQKKSRRMVNHRRRKWFQRNQRWGKRPNLWGERVSGK